MRRVSAKEKRIMALAYFHRYGWIAAMMACMAILPKQSYFVLSVAFISFSVWSFVGYKKKWKHIFCSNQNANHQKMTPHSIHWNNMRKSDAYGIPLVFFIIGLALFMVEMLY